MIPEKYKDFYGDQIRWFTGLIVDINDPIKLARVKVRIYGIHPDENVIPDADLPWAQVMTPTNEGGAGEIGNPLGLQVGALVFGMFMDGQHSQLPLVMGSLPKYEDKEELNDRLEKSTSRLARGTNTITKTPDGTIGAPAASYNAEYPHNKVTQTTSGHVIEIDDTPNAERIHIFHKSGTFVEMYPNGDVVTQQKNGWRSVTGNDKLHVTNDLDIIVGGNLNFQANTGTIQIGSGDVVASGISLIGHIHNNQDGPLTGPGPTSPPLGAEDTILVTEQAAAAEAVISDPLLTSIVFDT